MVRLAALLVLIASPALAAPHLLTEAQARARAVAILLGPPYGRTAAEVTRTLTEVRLIRMGETACGQTYQPLWTVHVRVPGPKPLEGDMLLDALTGKRVCATLPDLD